MTSSSSATRLPRSGLITSALAVVASPGTALSGHSVRHTEAPSFGRPSPAPARSHRTWPGFGIPAVLEHGLVGVIAETCAAPGPAPPLWRRRHLVHHCAAPPASRANLAGDRPTVLVKAVLNALAELQPVACAISSSERPPNLSASRATAIRHCRTYVIGGWPTRDMNRCEKTDQDILASVAIDATDQPLRISA
jgi:hypothetical protein